MKTPSSGTAGTGRIRATTLDPPQGISSVDCTVSVKIDCDLHLCSLLVALFHMWPDMFFHCYADFKLFCLDLPVEGLQLTQRAYQ